MKEIREKIIKILDLYREKEDDAILNDNGEDWGMRRQPIKSFPYYLTYRN